MELRHRPRRPPAMLAIAAGTAVAVGGLLVLAAWWQVRQATGAAASGPAPPGPTGALALTLGGAALYLLGPDHPGRARRVAGRVAALAATGAALASLLTDDAGRAAAGTVGGALAALLATAALAALPTPRPADTPGPAAPAAATRADWLGDLSDALSSTAATVALVAFAGYLFGAADPDRRAPLLLMPLATAAGVLVLAVGTALARAQHGPTSAFVGAGPGSAMARRLAPALLVLPFAAAGLSTAAARTGLLDPTAAVAAGTVLTILVLAGVFGYTVRRLNAAGAAQDALVGGLREERDLSATLLQSMSEGVVVLSGADRRVIEVNRRWCELAGRPRPEQLGQLPPYPWDADGGAIRRPDGSLVPILATTAEIPDGAGGVRAYVTTYVDMTEYRRVEENLAARADQLERAAAFKSDLMALVSHQMSQPLSSSASLAELLAADWDALPDDVRRELAVKIDRNTRRLTGMMKDLNLLFRLDAGTVTTRPAPVPVTEVVKIAVEALPEQITPVRNAVDGELYALIDRGHLAQILGNLLSNAVRHGQPPVEVDAREEPDGMVITVSDHGPGIPPDRVAGLFDRFAHGGGLGLFIVRHLAEANGGAVWYESNEPGARVHVRVPRAG